jgi:alpha-mannosidase
MVLGRTGAGGNSGFEGLVFLDHKPYQAVDSNHETMYLDDSFSGQKLEVAIKLWTGLEGGGHPQRQQYTLRKLSAGMVAQEVVDAYAYLSNIAGVVKVLPETEPLKYGYIKLLKRCLQQYDWANVTPVRVRNISVEITAQVKEFIAAHAQEKPNYQITAVGHTHIDVAWLWRLRHTHEKIARSFSTVLRLMNEFPEYHFFQSTPQDYVFLENDYPELFAKVSKRIAEGRWEANGGTWLEPDTNIPNGESLTRQFLYGGQYFWNHFRAKQNVLWLPDVFGYSAALPQIMRGFGIQNFMTTKISWNDTNRMPHDTFYWQGIDGSTVLTHFVTTVDDGLEQQRNDNWMYTYNGQITPQSITGSYRVYADKIINSDILLSYGFGDGGGGPTREQIRNVAILDELPGMPHVRQGRVDDYFDRLNQTVKQEPDLIATWRGELYLEYHRGTYTSQAKIKQSNRRAEWALRALEIRYTTAMVTYDVDYPTAEIKSLWEILLRNQFHDILPGSSIHEVYQDANTEFERLFGEISKLNQQLDSQLPPIHGLYNSLAWPVKELVSVGGHEALVTVPALSTQTLPSGTIADSPMAKITDKEIITTDYIIEFNSNGIILQIQDRHNGRNYLDDTRGGNVITCYEDRPLDFENWNIDRDYSEKATEVTADEMRIAVNDEAHAAIEFRYHIASSTITQTMIVYAGSPRIDFVTHVDWKARRQLLRVAFNTNILADNARFDIQYGNVLRSTTDNTSWDQAKFETVAHKWADLSQHDYGLALLNDSKYGYRVKDKQLSLTLLKAGEYPDESADLGGHDFTYSLLPHAGDFLEGSVIKHATELNQSLLPVSGKLPPLMTFETKQATALDTIKLSEDGQAIIVRFHDESGSSESLPLQLHFPVTRVQLVQLDEKTALTELPIKNQKIVVPMTPYGIQTLRLTR